MSSYDQWLTTEPYDSAYEHFSEVVAESLPEQFYLDNEEWLCTPSLYETWLNRLYDKDRAPKHVADVIVRAHSRYIAKQKKSFT